MNRLKLNTFSITARCPRTGQFGVAVTTAVPCVGALCPFPRAGAGAVASQSFVNPYLGHWGLNYLEQGRTAGETLQRLLERDPDKEKRQVAVVDRFGGTAAFSGNECDGWYGHFAARQFAVAGNMLSGRQVITAAADAFDRDPDADLAERLMRALEAGQAAGGDKRGKQSAAVVVVDKEFYPALNLRVDEHNHPVTELRRVYEAYKVELAPLMAMLPTAANPGGNFDLADLRAKGLLQDLPKATTFSIVARCPQTGQFGVAVSTKLVAVGWLCPFVQSGVGAVSSQSFLNPFLGKWSLEAMAQGAGAEDAVYTALQRDPNRGLRQIIAVGRNGIAAAYTGEQCDTWNGHIIGDGYAIAGNMLVGEETLRAMDEAFRGSTSETLAERLLRALEMGQAAGGDKRGKQSAALYVMGEEDYPMVDVRVDEHAEPVRELRRVFEVAKVKLFPLVNMLPTKKNPAGAFDMTLSREKGLLQDSR